MKEMKGLLQKIFINTLALLLTSQLLPGLVISGGFISYLIAGVAMTLLSLILKPVLQIITLPFQAITLGLFTYITNAILLWVLTKFVSTIQIHTFVFPGFALGHIAIPNIPIYSIILSYIVIAAVIAVMTLFLSWLINQ